MRYRRFSLHATASGADENRAATVQSGALSLTWCDSGRGAEPDRTGPRRQSSVFLAYFAYWLEMGRAIASECTSPGRQERASGKGDGGGNWHLSVFRRRGPHREVLPEKPRCRRRTLRIDGNSRQPASVRVENHNAPSMNWKHTLSPWHRFDSNSVHHLRLRLEEDAYRLKLDDQLVGEGAHECSFGWAHIILGVYSGHRGHGDVCWWDNLKVYRAQ